MPTAADARSGNHAASTDARGGCDADRDWITTPEVTREATVEDIEHIDELKLEDFAMDFSQVKLPETGRLSDEDLSVAVESSLETLRER